MRVTLDLLEDCLLPRVDRPNRYIGNILHASPRLSKGRLRVLIACPEVLERALPDPGLSALYTRLSADDRVSVELVFAPAADFASQLGRLELPFHSLETRTAAADFDVVLFHVARESSLPALPWMLRGMRLALSPAERAPSDPWIAACGPACWGAPFLSGFADLVLRGHVAGCADFVADRPALSPGPLRLAAPLSRPAVEPAGERFLQPLSELDVDRLVVETSRGCSPGCPTCAGGLGHERCVPRPLAEVVDEVTRGLEATGWEEVRLLMGAGASHPQLRELLEALERALLGLPTALTVSMLNGGDLSPKVAELLARRRRGPLALGPVGISERLRHEIALPLADAALLDSIQQARIAGWSGVKLHFTVGLPGETDADLDALGSLVRRAQASARESRTSGRGSSFHIGVIVREFAPLPGTRFERAAASTAEESAERLLQLRRRVPKGSLTFANHEESTGLHLALARGDERIAALLVRALDLGWTPSTGNNAHIIWTQAYKETGVYPTDFAQGYPEDAPLPWSLPEPATGDEVPGAPKGATPERPAASPGGGAPADKAGPPPPGPATQFAPPATAPGAPASADSRWFGRKPRKSAKTAWQRGLKFRVEYRKTEEVRFTSHLEIMRALERSLRRSGLPLAYSQGGTPHAKISSGPPLALGFTSAAEYVDLEFTRSVDEGFLEDLNACLNPGLVATEAAALSGKVDSLTAAVDLATWRARLTPWLLSSLGRDADAMVARWNQALHHLAREREPVLWPVKSAENAKKIDARGMTRGAVAERRGDLPEIRFETPVNGGMRPELFVARLTEIEGLDPRLVRVERTGLWITKGTRRLTPLMAVASHAGALAAAMDWS